MKPAMVAILSGWFVFVLFVIFGIYCAATKAEPELGPRCDEYGRNCDE